MKVSTLACLWIAVIIFAASNSVTKEIITIGQAHLVNGRNPISLCNVLLVGNIWGFLVMTLIFHRDWTKPKLRQLSRKHWFWLTIIALLSGALGPALIFTALDITNVTNVVLISRLEPVLTLVFGIWLLGSRVNYWTILGSFISFIGVGLTFLGANTSQIIPMMGFHLGRGELLATVAAVLLSVASIVNKKYLRGVPLGIFSVYRTFLGTVIFFLLANILYGPHHFAEAFSPFLWVWMLIYATIIVVIGQSFWFRGLMDATPSEVTLANSFSPIPAIIFAYLLLGEVPTSSQYRALTLVLLGVILSFLGSLQQRRNLLVSEMITGHGFRGF